MQFRSVIPATPAEVFAFHELPDALDRLTPRWEHVRIIERAADLRPGSRTVEMVRVMPLVWMRLEAVHTLYDPPRRFEDAQVRGPFRRWHHRHISEPHPEGALLIDDIDFQPPLAWLTGWFVRRRLRKLFAYRHRVTREYFESGGLDHDRGTAAR